MYNPTLFNINIVIPMRNIYNRIAETIMSRFKKYLLLFVIFLLINIFDPSLIYAQPVDPGCDPLDPACPIDGGVSLLIAAGIGIAAKKVYIKKKQEFQKLQ